MPKLTKSEIATACIPLTETARVWLDKANTAQKATNESATAKDTALEAYKVAFKAVTGTETSELTFSESKGKRAVLTALLDLEGKDKSRYLDTIKSGKISAKTAEDIAVTIWKEILVELPIGKLETCLKILAVEFETLTDKQRTELMKQITVTKIKDRFTNQI